MRKHENAVGSKKFTKRSRVTKEMDEVTWHVREFSKWRPGQQ